MFYACMVTAIKTKTECPNEFTNNIYNTIGSDLQFVDAASEDEAYGKMMKWLMINYLSKDGWYNQFVLVKKCPLTRYTEKV
jgi:predicted AlkP superfamily phosphohydrolase/phosphomutase